MHTQNSDCCRFRLKESCYCFEAGSAGDAIITYLRAADWRSRDAGALPSPSMEDQIRSYSHSVAFVKYRLCIAYRWLFSATNGWHTGILASAWARYRDQRLMSYVKSFQ